MNPDNMKIVVLGAGTAGLIAALMIQEKYPSYTITIVKSGEIGIIGVGEGSTEHWSQFMDFVNIDVLELLYETKATIKIGILFKEWCNNSTYAHSVIGDLTSGISSLNRPEVYNHLYLNGANREFPLNPLFEKIYLKNLVPLVPNFRCSNQYHFDTHKLNQYLVKKCKERDIVFLDAIVNNINLNTEGEVTELIIDNTTIPGDLFIDCSGFKRVIASRHDNKWISKSKYLPLNRAIAFPTELTNPMEIEPYTTSTALSSGWSWKIPTQERYGNGYVFSSDYITADQALKEINKNLNRNIESVAKDIKFEAGKIEKFWNKNVICIGLSGSFAEPLEAQSIGFSIIQTFSLLSYLDSWSQNKKVSEYYNKEMDNVFDNIIDYLQLHYLGNRTDTKFWKDKPFVLTDFNKENLPLFNRGIIDPSFFKGKDLMFTLPNWFQVLAGLNLIDKEKLFNSLNQNRVTYNRKYADLANNFWKDNIHFPLITHREYLDIATRNFLLSKDI